jgi:hypothetical protein
MEMIERMADFSFCLDPREACKRGDDVHAGESSKLNKKPGGFFWGEKKCFLGFLRLPAVPCGCDGCFWKPNNIPPPESGTANTGTAHPHPRSAPPPPPPARDPHTSPSHRAGGARDTSKKKKKGTKDKKWSMGLTRETARRSTR